MQRFSRPLSGGQFICHGPWRLGTRSGLARLAIARTDRAEEMTSIATDGKSMAGDGLVTGRQIAIGAMEAGKSPLEAVQIAARRNTETGGTISTLFLEEKVGQVA